jgi:ribosomal protein L37AE/L43A
MDMGPYSVYPTIPLDAAPVANDIGTGYMPSNVDSWSDANNMFQAEGFAEVKLEESDINCVEDDTVTLTRKELNDLIKSSDVKTGDASTPRHHPCPNCGRNFTRRFNMMTHLKTHDKSRYVEIELLMHSRPRPHSCEHCRKSFHRIADKQRHEEIHMRRQSASSIPYDTSSAR